jgi:hypothetical protein
MRSRLITCDRDWTVLTINGVSSKPIYLSYNDIEQVRIGYYTESKLFFKKTSEKIEIYARGMKKPIILTKPMDWEHFDQYKQEVAKFARDNKIKFSNHD